MSFAREDHDWPTDSAFLAYRKNGFVRDESSEKKQIKFYQSEYLKSGVKEKVPEPSFIQIFGFRKDLERHYSKSLDSRLRENDGKSSFYFNRPCFQTTFVSQADD
ncbi:hypothetical protein [Neisseria mucosa]|uniref:hypothetical protein n=1 Tax=Neisseria mucosa TaxID=488 RepID=UPI001878597A|nr:hypothetical protein [Neisseria mucosa]